jgi:uncharacterized protein YyaL (SSP411 family)
MQRWRSNYTLAGFVCALAIAAGSLMSLGANPPGSDAKDKPTNRLVHESSPYLLMHAYNPVDWYPWGPEAFAKAKKENKLVFLSIGYSSCYWCHVMERESFENQEVARLLNQWFVCIKVDREERPDIDTIYMTSMHVLRQSGGWPLSMFLTADAKPIVGGTYWPPDDKEKDGQKYRGFKGILQFVHQWYNDKPKEVLQQADHVAEATTRALAETGRPSSVAALDRPLVDGAVAAIGREFDPIHGGFGSAEHGFRGTKFPTPPYLDLLLTEIERAHSPQLLDMLTLTLDEMARGGIYDHVGGGFHRYSTERTWTVPHFEKMLYDNAQLVEIYARAFRLTHKPLYRKIVQETVAFIRREMTVPPGRFASALDAETGGVEGRFYVWTDSELTAALGQGPDLDFVKKVYAADGAANFENRYHILRYAQSPADTARAVNLTEEQLESRLAPLRQKLFQARASRVPLFLDYKTITGWNGQMIAGLAVAGQALQEPAFIQLATQTAESILKDQADTGGRLLHAGVPQGMPSPSRLAGYLDDYTFLVDGLLKLHDATGDGRWLDEAKQRTDVMVPLFEDGDRGGFFFSAADGEKLFARARDQYDGAQPAGNSMAARNFTRLWLKTGNAKYRDLAEKTLKTFAGSLAANPTSLTSMVAALDDFLAARSQPAPAPTASKEPALKTGNARRSDGLVTVKANASPPDASGKQDLTVVLTVNPGWHIYANPVAKDFPGIPTTITVGAKVKPMDIKIDYPRGQLIHDPFAGDHFVYEGTIVIKAVVKRAPGDASPLEVAVRIQACNKEKCLLPATVKVPVP